MSIKVENVTKRYGNQLAVNNLSFEIAKGEIVGFLGPNGAGKSTTLKMLMGYVTPSEGEIFVEGAAVGANQKDFLKKVGYLPEHNPLYQEMYVKEYLRTIAQIHKVGGNCVATAIQKTGLLPESTKKIKELSKGYQQRVGLAAAILHNPSVLVLDEPTTGLDPNQIIEIRELIRELGKDKIVLFSTHIMQEVEAVCDRVIIINKGDLKVDENLTELKKGKQQVIEVEFDFRIEKQFIAKIPELVAFNNFHDTHWELTFDTQTDMRSFIFDFAKEQGLKILQLTTKNKTLESLFKEVTAN